MLNKLKKNLTYVLCAGIGLLNFIFLAFNYVAVYSKSRYGDLTEGLSGYQVLKIWGNEDYYFKDGKFGGVMSSMLQLFILLLGIALLAWGVLGLLKAFGMFEKFPDKVAKLDSKKIGEYGLFGIAGLNVLLLVFLIIFVASQKYKITNLGYTSEYGYKLSAGIFITIIFTVGAVVALKILEKKFPDGEDTTETISYVCSKCGKKAKASDKFCNACGGEVGEKTMVKEEYVCEKCGKKATEKDKFCNACGGEIKVKGTSSIKEETNVPIEESASQN